MISMVKLRILETDSKFRLRGETLRMAIQVSFFFPQISYIYKVLGKNRLSIVAEIRSSRYQ